MGRIRADSHATPPNTPEPCTDTSRAPGASGRAGGAPGRVFRQPAPPDSAISEADFLALVVGYARALGYSCYHTWRSDHSESGYPDLTIVGNGKIVFVELKARKGRMSPPQCRWARATMQAGGIWRLWRPCAADWLEMQQLLGGAPGEG